MKHIFMVIYGNVNNLSDGGGKISAFFLFTSLNAGLQQHERELCVFVCV